VQFLVFTGCFGSPTLRPAANWVEQMGTSGASRQSSVLFSVALSLIWLAGLAALDGARAQNVVNSDFAFPSAANVSGKVFVNPPATPQTGWTFTQAGNNASGVQQNGSTLGGPAAPNGEQQTAFITDLGSISQTIDFKLPGDYALSFQIAAQAGGTPSDQNNENSQSIVVYVGTQEYGPYTPHSTASFNPVTISFKVAAGNPSQTLKFVGYGLGTGGQLLAGELSTVFIADVAIKAVAPQIAKGPSDIDPTTTVELSGQHFGAVPGKIRVHFPTASQVHFAKTSSKSDLDLDVPGPWGDTIKSEALDKASDVGAPDEQTAEITVIAANGASSNVWKAKFHNIPVITGVSPGTITPSQTFNVTGWDFGKETGKVKVHFTDDKYKSPSLDGQGDVDADISKWTPGVVNASLKKSVGTVVEQTVDVSLTPKGGSTSNTWKETFKPRIVQTVILPNFVSVLQCSNGGAANLCNNPGPVSFTCFGFGIAASVDTVLDNGMPALASVYAVHAGCPAGSDSGTDVYQAVVQQPLTIVSVQYFDAVYQAGYNANASAIPGTAVTVNVPWETSSDGGEIEYEIVITAQGPQGFQP
jgi:hypothetical protein